jgi:hypothetical protein
MEEFWHRTRMRNLLPVSAFGRTAILIAVLAKKQNPNGRSAGLSKSARHSDRRGGAEPAWNAKKANNAANTGT